MKALIIQVAAILCFISSAYGQEERRAYMNLEKGDPLVSVFRKPGLNWKFCQKNAAGECVDAMGWLDRKAKVWVTGPKIKVATPDPHTHEIVEEEYYPVRFEYQRMGKDKNGKDELVVREKGPIGYVDAAYIDFEQREPIYSSNKSPKPDSKACKFNSSSMKKNMEDFKCAVVQKNIETASEQIKSKVGFCGDMKDDDDHKANLYDNVILKKLKKVSVPKVKGEDNIPMTQEQMIDIDSLARTLYGEMASCYKHGLHYPMAVARVVVNRRNETKLHNLFIRGPHLAGKPVSAKVATSASQFSVWLRKLNGKKNHPLGMAMCPPRAPDQKLWTGIKPSAEELAIWNHTVKIATEAVLFPQSFKNRTEKLDQRFYYTSGMGQFYKMKKDSVQIEGRNLDKSKCIEIWNHNKS